MLYKTDINIQITNTEKQNRNIQVKYSKPIKVFDFPRKCQNEKGYEYYSISQNTG